MKKETKKIIRILVYLTLAIAFIAVIHGVSYLEKKDEVKQYNNGICRVCGEPFKFTNGSKYSGLTTYFYSCKNGHIIEISSTTMHSIRSDEYCR